MYSTKINEVYNILYLGLCCAETIPTESGTTYRWPETLAGASTTFICPLSREHSVTRVCSSIGEWQSFNEEGCGVANGQLIELEDVFANVRVIIINYNSNKPE